MDDTGFHPAFHSFSYRARLDRSNGNHDNQVIWLSRTGGVVPEPVRRHAHVAGQPARKPAEAKDACFMAGGVQGDLTCNGTWQYYGNPRLAAGAPVHVDVVKCQLKPLVRGDYAVTFTRRAVGDAPGRRSRRASATTPARRRTSSPPKARWLTFAGGPGGQPLGNAPGRREIAPGTVGGTVPRDALAVASRPRRSGRSRRASRATTRRRTTATVTSTAGDATLSVADPGHLANGAFTLPEPLRVDLSQARLDGADLAARPSPSRSSSASSPPTRCGRAPTRRR